ncbi:hypothetical protein [Brachybacterium sp. GCM10030252]|uniref:hypothetical protein n=1 Tax=Brachybacterium sp. GCM10030252 TaxID=3273380 RepID=UPI003617ACC8
MLDTRRYLVLGGAVGLFSLLTGCRLLRPAGSSVVEAMESAPGVTGAEINFGPGGGLRSHISGTITLGVTSEALHDAFDEAWRRGVEALHRRYDGERGILVDAIFGEGADGAEVTSTDLVELGRSRHATLGHFYDHYGAN